MLLACSLLTVASSTAGDGVEMLYDFEGKSGRPAWVPENDGVMGGVSEGAGKIEGGALVFQGKLSLENNGGFASLQTEDGEWDFSKAKGVKLRIMGDGRSYQFRVATDARMKGSRIDYAADFPTEEGKWLEVRIPFSEMKPTWRGRKLKGPELNLGKVEQLRVLLGDKREGSFSLMIDWIATYR
jgi:hypothetical protein